ncbi:MAG: DUF2752 domain-containing protein [Actinomycetota bacterium]|nr:DUF2752 domain-containing protein [Actinomycetota bacterium]
MTAFPWHLAGTRSQAARGPSRLIEVDWADSDGARALAWLAAAGVVGALALALLGLPPVNMHGPLHRLWGIMDPLCGGTRAVYWMARGRLGLAWMYNPGALLLGAFTAGAYGRAFYGRLSGRWLVVRIRFGLLVTLIATALIALEVNQQLHAALLMGT